jgi:HSP20 family molecular chaperone IbpA
LIEDFDAMTRVSLLSSPLLLGFEEIERLLDRAGKSANDGYPPYNIERITRAEPVRGNTSAPAAPADGRNATSPGPDLLRISLAVAGFTRDQLEITVEDSQLVVRGRQAEDKSRDFLYRGIATRQFQRTFVLADGIEVQAADLSNGLLSIDLVRIEPERLVRRIDISELGKGLKAASGGLDQRVPDTRHITTGGTTGATGIAQAGRDKLGTGGTIPERKT